MRFYKIAMFKASFEKGYSLMSYPKWVLALLGLGNIMLTEKYALAIIGAFAFFIFCTVLGYILIKCGFYEAENEVGNQYNLFVKQMRRKIKTKSI